MIAFIKGKLADIQAGSVVLDVGGIGYRVRCLYHCSTTCRPGAAKSCCIPAWWSGMMGFTCMAFRVKASSSFFLKLLNVSGVGPKGALAILSIYTPGELGRAIAGEDIPLLTRVSGIGKKTAGRIVLELKDKVAGMITSFRTRKHRYQPGDRCPGGAGGLGLFPCRSPQGSQRSAL